MPGIIGFFGTKGNDGSAGVPGTSGSGGAATSPEIDGSVTTKTLQLVVTAAPPHTAAVGQKFAMTVAVEDSQGHIESGFNGTISVKLTANPGGATFGGTTTVTASAGIAVFSDLTLNKGGKGYTIEGLAGGATSGPVTIDINGSPPPPPPPPPQPLPVATQVAGTPSVVKSKKGISAFVVGFNQPLNASSAAKLSLYHVFQGVKKKHKEVFTKALKIKSVSYTASSHKVTINLKKPYKGIVEVAVDGAIEALDGTFTTLNFSSIVK